jgi:hypothetical protein
MRTIAELTMLLRPGDTLTDGLQLVAEEFREGWQFARSAGANRMEKKVRARGGHFIGFADGLLRSGVGDTSQEAIASALMLALRRVSAHFNAVEVEHIELTQYPWFFLARVRVHPYRIQQDAAWTTTDEAAPRAIAPRQRRLPRQPAELYPNFGTAMPMLKEMLVLSRNTQGRAK